MKKTYVKPRCTVLPVFPRDPLSASTDGGEPTDGTPGTNQTPQQPAPDLPTDKDPYADDRTWL